MRVAILDDYQNCTLSMADWSPVEKDCEITVFNDHLSDEDEIAARLADFEIVCAMRERTRFGKSQLAKLPKLKLLISSGMRNRSFDVAAAAGRGIVCCGTPSVGAPTTDIAWGLIIGLLRNIPKEDAAVRRGEWQSTVGPGLHGKTLGIAGLGKLGSKMAVIGKAFDMDVIAWSQNLTRARCDEFGVGLVTKEELMKRSDVITIHLILSDRTRGVIGRDELALMKPGAILVNTSRGPIVDEAALVDALERRAIRGAGLDVYGTEPLRADSPFRRLENTVVTPHLGYVEESNYQAYFNGYIAAIRGFLDGKPVNVMSAD
ncbi:MAG: D-2-hydroxyacid dehydrogenase family protein [Alphaproteobacteria bacterium]|nr:D-2-hydroxyacid dehydrogenase family protein [Alphaproteobacteria bacterium]